MYDVRATVKSTAVPLSPRIGVIPPVAVPNGEALPAPDHFGSAHESRAQPKHLPAGVRTQLPTRRRDRLPQNDDGSLMPQGAAKGDFFGRIEPLVEAADGLERRASAKDVAP